MKLEHNMEPDELAMSLSGIILSEGIEDRVLDTLSKSKKGGGETPQEPEVRKLITMWKNHHRALLRETAGNIDKWIEHKRTTGPRGWWFFQSPETENELTLEDVMELEELVFSHYKASAGFTGGMWSSAYADEWSRLGLQVPLSNFQAIAREAYTAGRGDEGLSASTFTGIHAGSYVVSVGTKTANRVFQRGVESLQSIYPGTVGHFVNRNKEIDRWGELGKVAKEVVSDADWRRDMDRIGATETRWAYNVGLLQNYVSQGYDKVYYAVQPTACSNCRRLLLHPDGRPKILSIRTLLIDISTNGGMNAYRDEQQWKPTACIHPHCHCSIQPYSPTS